MDIEIDTEMLLRQLEPSQQQLVAIVRALSTNASTIILDEPTSCLTKKETDKLFIILKKLKDAGKCLIYISHKLDEVIEIADRVTVLRDGNTVGILNKDEFTHDKIVRLMVGRDIQDMYPKNDAPKGGIILEVEDLTIDHKHISDKKIISGVSFKAYAGEIVGLAGLVGAGRSEILNAIFGSYKGNYTGKIKIRGKAIFAKSPWVGKKAGIGLLTEDRRFNGLIQEMSVKNNITLANIKGITQRKIISEKIENRISEKFIQRLNLKTPSGDTLVMNLSGGNQQKVVLSKWLNLEPVLLLLDEPTRGIDVGSKNEIYQIMINLARQGKCIVWASSEMSELLEVSDRVIILHDGVVKGEMTRDEVTQERVMTVVTGGSNIN
jgi:ABC-type sugar transport system ATPase subunit